MPRFRLDNDVENNFFITASTQTIVYNERKYSKIFIFSSIKLLLLKNTIYLLYHPSMSNIDLSIPILSENAIKSHLQALPKKKITHYLLSPYQINPSLYRDWKRQR